MKQVERDTDQLALHLGAQREHPVAPCQALPRELISRITDLRLVERLVASRQYFPLSTIGGLKGCNLQIHGFSPGPEKGSRIPSFRTLRCAMAKRQVSRMRRCRLPR